MKSDFITIGGYIHENSGALIRRISFLTKSASTDDTVNDFVAQLGYRPLPKAWTRLNYEDAFELIESLISYELAYGGPLISPVLAPKITEDFIGSFSSNVIFLSNGVSKFKNGHIVSDSYYPIGKATFDRGVVFLDGETAAILWQEDDD